jgi:aspartyl-tRNA(Asn)/glutamyl-tRNA(Gln) amidotransferase subunit A
LVNALRERRTLISASQSLWSRFVAHVTAGPGPAPLLEAWRTIHFWQRPSLTTPFNVLGGPALAQCIGFSPEGLPLSMQVVGRPFADATVLRIADAYECATPWRRNRPLLDTAAAPLPLPPIPDPMPSGLAASERDAVALIARRAGFKLDERQFELLFAAAPYVEGMAGRLRSPRGFDAEPSSVFAFTGYGETRSG